MNLVTTDVESKSSKNGAGAAMRQKAGFVALLWLLFVFCRILSWTWRIRVVGMDRRRRGAALGAGRTCLLASFHENAVGGLLSHIGQKICLMVSQSKDGELVAFIGERFGYKSVRGSSSRGGKAVRDAMVDAVNLGYMGAITVDGPRGPRRILKNGIADISKKTQTAIVPISCVGKSAWILRKTWDQTRIPKPFSRVLVHYGEPVLVPEDATQSQFQSALDQLTSSMNTDDEFVRLRFEELWRHGQRQSLE